MSISDEHGHTESLVKQCEEKGGKYCFSPDGNTDNDCLTAMDAYCECLGWFTNSFLGSFQHVFFVSMLSDHGVVSLKKSCCSTVCVKYN